MSLHCHHWRRGLSVACWMVALLVAFPLWMQVAAQEPDPEEAREKAIVDRFVTVLEKNPRRGTALDKVYGFHVERGSLNDLIKTYREKTGTGKGREAAPAWMIVGLLESLRGQDAASVEAFGKAEQLDPASYLSSYYLGLSQVLIGQPDKAAEALERSTQRKPAPADQLDIFQALGRVYQRAQKSDKALEVWNRLEKQFPNDTRVQEQIATTLLEEGEFAAALPRFENLVKTTKDKYRQSLFQMEAAEIKVRLGKSADAILEFEKLLGQLNPDNWLFREVRRRIENVYLRTDDQAGLVAYYDSWLKKHAEDLDAITRLARLLAGLGRGPEAQQWLEQALKSAPTKKDLRLTLIGQLLFEQKFAAAITHYEQLDKYDPNNPDTLRDRGRAILKDTSREESTRKTDAAAVWKRMITAKPKDALVASQVAELFRQVEMTDEALQLYQKAVSLAPDATQYKEYLGEYFHSLKRTEDAFITWRQMAQGDAKTAANVARLAEVLAGFGYLTEAVETNAEACKLDPKEINLQIRQVDLLSQAEKHDDALRQLDVVRKLAANDEEREAWLSRELKVLQATDKLKDRMNGLRKELDEQTVSVAAGDKGQPELADKWYWLARAYEFDRQLKEAGQAVTKASEFAPQSIPMLMASGRIQEAQNNLLAAVEINTKLAAVDRRYRTEYLKKVAQLELQLGRREKGIQAGRDLLAAAPGNPELYEFFSQLCFQLGETEEGLQALRRSVRVNPTEPKGLLLLANALSEQFRTSEAIELYWRAFEKAGSLEDRLGVVPKLADLYLQTNQLDRLLERLERQRREPNQQREMTICLAQAYQSAGDDGNARQELEKLLTDDTRDTQLLQQLIKLCESDGDLDMAVRYQQQLNKSTPGKEGVLRLAQLLTKAGETEEAATLMAQLTSDEKDPEQVLKSIDALLTQKQFDQALTIVRKLTCDQPKNWELLYREGAMLAKSSPDEAAKRFEAILGMKLKDDEQGLIAKGAAAKAAKMPRTSMARQQRSPLLSLQTRVQSSNAIRQAVNLDNRNLYNNPQQQPFWAPSDFGQARMASIAWQMLFAQNGGKLDDFFAAGKAAATKAADRRDLLDWYYLTALKRDPKETYLILKQLSLRPDADREISQMYLYSLQGRGPAEIETEITADDPADAMEPDDASEDDVDRNGNPVNLAPLARDELDHVLATARQLASLTEIDQYNWGVGTHLELIAGELKRSGRKAEARKMYDDALANAKEPIEIASILPGVVQRGDYTTAIRLLDRLLELAPGSAAQVNVQGNFNYAQYVMSPPYQAQLLCQLMMNRARAKQLDEVLMLWTRYVRIVEARAAAPPTPQTLAAKKQQKGSSSYNNNSQYYNIWQSSGQQRGEQLDFPMPNDVYDASSIQMLRQAFALYREAEQSARLTDAFTAALKDPATPTNQRQLWQFGLGYLHWWNDDKDESLAILREASQQIPNNTDITFEMARLHEKRREFADALALIDTITPGDQAALQQREVMALRLSVNGGDIERARLAAERLFGLRLDSNLQMALARQMHQLGMHEQAEAVLARAGRQAGNKTEILGGLMEQYAASGKNDVAVQIAHQLLRRSKPGGVSGPQTSRMRQMNMGGDSGIRTQALQVMNRSGKLPEMISKVEAQLKNSPKSLRLLETLQEYYIAAGNDKKVEELNRRLSESKGDDPKFRYQLAMKLLDAGKTSDANEHLKIVFEKEPMLVMNQYWELQNKYQSHNKLEDLATLYESIDLKVFRQQPYVLSNAISNLSQREQTKPRALALFKKAWEAIPDSRSQLLGQMHDENFWKLPEIYDYAREGVIPSPTMLQQNRWAGYGNGMSYNQGGKVTTLHTRVLDIAASQKKLDALGEEVAAATKKTPAWVGGKALLGMIELRKGHIDEARTAFEVLLPSFKKVSPNDQNYIGYALREIGQELMAHDSCGELAIRYFEQAVANSQNDGNDFEYRPAKPLMELLKKQGRKAEARQVLLDNLQAPNRNFNNVGYDAYRRISSAATIGKEFQDLGYPADAIKIYQRALSSTDDIREAQQYTSVDHYLNLLRTGLGQSLEQLKPESLAELLAPPVKPSSPPKPDATRGNLGGARDLVKVEEPTDDFASVDLIPGVDSQDLAKSRMTSALVNLVAGLVQKPELLDKTNAALAEARSKRPDDIGAAILVTHIAVSSRDNSAKISAVDELIAMIDRLPLDAPPEKGGFTARQRIAAMQQAQLWLVARECWKNELLRAAGDKLATRSLEAAKRLSDRGYALAILREWGQIAIDAGDTTTAEQKWIEMLDLVIPKPGEKPKQNFDPATVGGEKRAVQVVTASGAASFVTRTVAVNAEAALTPGTKGQAVTFSQFQKAAQIAQLAAENGLNDLSIKAIEQSLHGGPPLEAMQDVQAGNPFGGGTPVNDQSQSIVQVQQQLALIEQLWRRKGVADERIYLALRGALMPVPRSHEVFIYPQPLANSRDQSPQSVAALVVRAAVKAKQTEDLRTRLEAKLGQPLGELSARIVLTQLALATGDAKVAGEQLDLIAERVKLDSIANTRDLACHAALPALASPELAQRAIIIIERAADQYAKNSQATRDSVEEPIRSFRFKLADFHFRNGNIESGKKHLDAWVTQLGSMWSNYGGDYPQYRRKSEYLSVAAAFARHRQRSDSLELLGRHADLPATSDYGVSPVGLAGAVILRGLALQSPAEQYDLLKGWSLPTADRRSVRLMSGLIAGDRAPLAFDPARDGTPRFTSQPEHLSTADLLVTSAAATGQLDALQHELEPLAAEKVEYAQFLLLLTRLAQPNDAQIANDLRSYFTQRQQADAEADKNPNNNRRSERPDATNVILAQAALRKEATLGLGIEMCAYQIGRLGRYQDHPQMTFLRHLYNSALVGADRSARMDGSPRTVDQTHWTGGAHSSAVHENGGAVPMWWLVHEGKLQHICGPDQSYLFLNYPLTGTFEFSCDTWLGGWAEGNAGYGGLVFEALNLGGGTSIYPTGRRNQPFSRPDPLEIHEKFNRISIRVTPETVKHFVNGALIHEEPASSTTASPWLLLQCDRVWQTAFKNVRIEGEPTIPREVILSSSPTLVGWTAAFYDESLPPHFKPPVETGNPSNRQPPPPEIDWWMVDGEIRGRHFPTAALLNTSVLQSRLHYCRPLRNGERLKYEFWYEPGPGEVHVHPALDRLAMILAPDGVKLHWMTESNDETLLTKGLPANNLIVDETARRGPGQLPLKVRDWNRVELTLNTDTMKMSLNDTPIFERVLEPGNDRQFGFYHDKHATSVRVRNVVLSGDWPETLSREVLANLLAPARPHSVHERQQISRTFDDKFEAINFDQVLRTTRGLPPAERYASLKSWVLPNDDHATVRFYGDIAPSDSLSVTPQVISPVNILDGTIVARTQSPFRIAKPSGDSKSVDQPSVSKRQRSGGELIAPVLDLVAVARQLGKLDELAESARNIPDTTEVLKRSRRALLALIAMSANDSHAAATLLQELTPARDKGLPDDLPINDRWPELIAAWEATRKPELCAAAVAILEVMLDSVNRKGMGAAWDIKVRSARQHAQLRLEKETDLPLASAISPGNQWSQSTLTTAAARGSGMVPRWRFQGTEATHLGGEGNDFIYFQSPLRGKFTVEGDLSTFGWREARPMYAALWAGPQYTHEAADIGNLTGNWVGPKFATKIEPMGDWFRLKLDVTPEKVTYYANERMIHEQPLTDNADPWFAIHSFGQYAASVRSLRILGEPEIPGELLLSKRDDLQGWWGEMYGDQLTGESPAWKKNGDEITGHKLPGWERRSRESLLQYHRPMLEDGEITYEFFHVPNQTHVHPAIGRMVMMLEPDGVKIHWLTDAQFERGGLKPDNLFVEPEHRRGSGPLPLKVHDWNKVSLGVRGDMLSVVLNAEVIYERPLDASNLRTFGLFHYMGDTDVRVKNVVYRGSWPRTLPPVNLQELAGNDQELATFKADELPAAWSWNFQGERSGNLKRLGEIASNAFSSVDGGLRIVREANPERTSESAGFHSPGMSIEGDFEVTLGYRDFQSSTKSESHQVPRIEIILAIGDGFGGPQHSHTLALTHSRRPDGSMQFTSILGIRRNPPAEDWLSSDRHLVATEGRIRIVRRGATAYYLRSKLADDNWELLDRRPVSTADVKDLLIGFRSEDLAGSGSVILTEFSIRAQTLK